MVSPYFLSKADDLYSDRHHSHLLPALQWSLLQYLMYNSAAKNYFYQGATPGMVSSATVHNHPLPPPPSPDWGHWVQSNAQKNSSPKWTVTCQTGRKALITQHNSQTHVTCMHWSICHNKVIYSVSQRSSPLNFLRHFHLG